MKIFKIFCSFVCIAVSSNGGFGLRRSAIKLMTVSNITLELSGDYFFALKIDRKNVNLSVVLIDMSNKATLLCEKKAHLNQEVFSWTMIMNYTVDEALNKSSLTKIYSIPNEYKEDLGTNETRDVTDISIIYSEIVDLLDSIKNRITVENIHIHLFYDKNTIFESTIVALEKLIMRFLKKDEAQKIFVSRNDDILFDPLNEIFKGKSGDYHVRLINDKVNLIRVFGGNKALIVLHQSCDSETFFSKHVSLTNRLFSNRGFDHQVADSLIDFVVKMLHKKCFILKFINIILQEPYLDFYPSKPRINYSPPRFDKNLFSLLKINISKKDSIVKYQSEINYQTQYNYMKSVWKKSYRFLYILFYSVYFSSVEFENFLSEKILDNEDNIVKKLLKSIERERKIISEHIFQINKYVKNAQYSLRNMEKSKREIKKTTSNILNMLDQDLQDPLYSFVNIPFHISLLAEFLKSEDPENFFWYLLSATGTLKYLLRLRLEDVDDKTLYFFDP